MKTATEITANAIYKVTSKTTNETCWYVPADSQVEPYKVCYDSYLTIWTCECKHGQVCRDRAITPHCKHVKAVQTSILANKVDTLIEQVTEKQELHTCDTCWRQVKPEFTTCSVCLGQ